MDRGQQGAFLVAGGACTALLAGIGDEHLMQAVRASHAGDAFVQIAALEKSGHGALDQRPPEAVPSLKTLVVDLLECRKMLIHQAPQVGGVRIAWTVKRQRLDTRGHHGRNGNRPEIVYTLSLDPMYTSCQPEPVSYACNYWGSRWLRRAEHSAKGVLQRGKLPASPKRAIPSFRVLHFSTPHCLLLSAI